MAKHKKLKKSILKQLHNLEVFDDLTWIWNDYCDHYNLDDQYIDVDYSSDYCEMSLAEIEARVDFDKLADYVIAVKYWQAMPEMIHK